MPTDIVSTLCFLLGLFYLYGMATRKGYDVNGKVVLVTGAGSGIGKGLSKAMASQGAEVVLVDINMDALLEAKQEIKGKTHIFQCDVSNFKYDNHALSLFVNV